MYIIIRTLYSLQKNKENGKTTQQKNRRLFDCVQK